MIQYLWAKWIDQYLVNQYAFWIGGGCPQFGTNYNSASKIMENKDIWYKVQPSR